VKERVYAKGNFRISQFYWYITNNGIITNRLKERLKHGIDAMLNRDTRVVLIRISSTQYLKEQGGRHDLILTEFTKNISRILKEFIPF